MSPAPAVADQVLRTRRAVGLLLMSAVVPGSAQYVRGNRALGVTALRIWAGCLAAVVLAAAGFFLFRGPTVGFLLNPLVAATLRVLVWLLFIGWLLLLVDAWRIADPLQLPSRWRLWLTGTVVVVAVAAGFATNFAASAFVAAQNVGDVFVGGGDTQEKAGRYNILLLGADAAASRDGLRPDSINVASIDAETGRTVIFGLPRNMQKVPFPESNPLHDLYPGGYDCPESACMLNGVWTLAEDHKDLFKDEPEPGLRTTKDVVSEVLGLELNYYAMVDMGGFKSLIDAMGGITLDLNKAIPIGGGSTNVHGYIGPGLGIHLDGYHALWVARSRHDSSDYERMVRQKCVMSAMAKQLDPGTVATKFVELSAAGKDILHTDVGTDHLAELAELTLRGKSLDVVSVNFAPPLIKSADPDFDLIRQTVQDEVAKSEKLDEGAPVPSATPSASATPSTSAVASAKPTATASPKPTAAATPTPAAKPTKDAKKPGKPLEVNADGEPAWVCRVTK